MMTMMIKMITLFMKIILIRFIKVMGFLSIPVMIMVGLDMVNLDLADKDTETAELVGLDLADLNTGNLALVDLDMINSD